MLYVWLLFEWDRGSGFVMSVVTDFLIERLVARDCDLACWHAGK